MDKNCFSLLTTALQIVIVLMAIDREFEDI